MPAIQHPVHSIHTTLSETSVGATVGLQNWIDQSALAELVSLFSVLYNLVSSNPCCYVLHTYPVLVETHALANFCIRQDHRRRTDGHTLLQGFQGLSNTLELRSYKRPWIGNSAKSQFSEVLRRQILGLSTLDDFGKISI